jgi:hypothetical protein
MAKDFKRTRDQGLVAALDIGASKVACVIAQLSDAFEGEYEVDVVGVGQHGAALRDKAPDFDASTAARSRRPSAWPASVSGMFMSPPGGGR